MTAPSYVHNRSEEGRVLNWQKEVAKSTARRPSLERLSATRVIVNHITKPTVIVSHAPTRPKEETEINTRAIIGTILGASAGAAVAYAMVRGEQEDRLAQEGSRMEYSVKRVKESAVVVRPALADVQTYKSQHNSTYDMDDPQSYRSISRTRLPSLVSSARSEKQPQTAMLRSVPPHGGSHTGHTIIQTKNGTKVLSGTSHTRTSHTPPRSKTGKHPASAVNVPLPQSHSSTQITRHGSIVPDDSISQVSTNRPRDKARSSSDNPHGSSKSGSSHRRHAAYASGSTARPDRR